MDEQSNISDKAQGTEGVGLFSKRIKTRGDCQLVERYATHLSGDKRDAVMAKVVIALLGAKTPRDIAALARVYGSFDRINLDYLRFDLEQQQHDVSEEVAKEKAAMIVRQIAAMKASVPGLQNDNDTDPAVDTAAGT